MSAINLFSRDILGLDNDEAAQVLDAQIAEVQSDFDEAREKSERTTVKAAYATRYAVRLGRIKTGSGGSLKPGQVTMKDFGAKFLGVNGEPVSQSTVGIWLNVGYLLLDVDGFDVDGATAAKGDESRNDRHAKLLSKVKQLGNFKAVKEAVRDEKATVAKVEKAVRAVEADKKKKAADKAAAEAGTGTPETPNDDDANKDETGNIAPVGPVRSSIEQALEAVRLVQVLLPDLTGADFQKFDRAWDTVSREVTAKRDALNDMIDETETATAKRTAAKKSA